MEHLANKKHVPRMRSERKHLKKQIWPGDMCVNMNSTLSSRGIHTDAVRDPDSKVEERWAPKLAAFFKAPAESRDNILDAGFWDEGENWTSRHAWPTVHGMNRKIPFGDQPIIVAWPKCYLLLHFTKRRRPVVRFEASQLSTLRLILKNNSRAPIWIVWYCHRV